MPRKYSEYINNKIFYQNDWMVSLEVLCDITIYRLPYLHLKPYNGNKPYKNEC